MFSDSTVPTVGLKLDVYPGNNRLFWPNMRKHTIPSSNVSAWLMNIETDMKAAYCGLRCSLKENGVPVIVCEGDGGWLSD